MAEVIEGMAEAVRSFKHLKDAVKPRIVRSAMNAALNPGLKAVRAAAPRGTEQHKTYKGRTVAPGFLSRSAKKSTRLNRGTNRVLGKISFKPEAFYGSFGEFGTKNQPADPFFFDAIDNVQDQMQKAYFGKMNDRIQKEFSKR